jgi:hypothetical protein
MRTCRFLIGLLAAAVAVSYLAGGLHRVGAQQAVRTVSYSATPCGGYTLVVDANGNLQAQTYLVGDLNGDGRVDVSDLLIMAASWNLSTGDPGFNPEADLNCDGHVNLLDLMLLAPNFGT